MKLIRVFNKQKQLVSDLNRYEDPTEFINFNISINAWGKPERWILENSESYEPSDILKTEMKKNKITGGQETWVLLSADYIIEIVDLATDYNYLLNECYENRKREYPALEDLANALFWKEQGDDSKYIDYMKRCEEVKIKYPKPIKE